MLEKNGWIVDGGVWLLLFIMRNQQLPEVQWQVADDGEDDGEGDGVDEMKMAMLYYWGGFRKKERLEEPASFPT